MMAVCFEADCGQVVVVRQKVGSDPFESLDLFYIFALPIISAADISVRGRCSYQGPTN